MTANYCKIDTLDLFNDLKDTNISFSEFKSIVACYNKLESSYIKDKQVDLLKDLNKQKRVIFSYLKSCKDEPIKKMAKLVGKLEEEFGDIDEMNTFSKANKNAKFIKVSYDNGKWSISAEGLSDNLEFNKKQTPEAITCLVQLADRLDEQDAAYALCHAKKAGLFTIAALPFVRTDLNNTLFNTRYEKTPTTTLGPIEKPADAVYTTNLPVSRQIASEDDVDNEKIDETSVFIDEDGTLIPITLVADDYVLTSQDNGVYSIEEVKENLKTGKWKRQAADKEDIKKKKIISQIDNLLSENYKEKMILNEMMRREVESFQKKLQAEYQSRIDKLDEITAKTEPKVRKLLAKLDRIQNSDEGSIKKLHRIKLKLESGLTVTYSPEVEKYQKRVVNLEKAQTVLDQIADKYIPKSALADYEKDIENMYYYTSSSEKLFVQLTGNDPANEELIQEEINKLDKLKKNVKMSSLKCDNKTKNNIYNELDNMLISNMLNFNQYNALSDFIEYDAKQVAASLRVIKTRQSKITKAGLLSDIVSKILSIYNSLRNLFLDMFNKLTLQETYSNKINEGLDEIIEGE